MYIHPLQSTLSYTSRISKPAIRFTGTPGHVSQDPPPPPPKSFWEKPWAVLKRIGAFLVNKIFLFPPSVVATVVNAVTPQSFKDRHHTFATIIDYLKFTRPVDTYAADKTWIQTLKTGPLPAAFGTVETLEKTLKGLNPTEKDDVICNLLRRHFNSPLSGSQMKLLGYILQNHAEHVTDKAKLVKAMVYFVDRGYIHLQSTLFHPNKSTQDESDCQLKINVPENAAAYFTALCQQSQAESEGVTDKEALLRIRRIYHRNLAFSLIETQNNFPIARVLLSLKPQIGQQDRFNLIDEGIRTCLSSALDWENNPANAKTIHEFIKDEVKLDKDRPYMPLRNMWGMVLHRWRLKTSETDKAAWAELRQAEEWTRRHYRYNYGTQHFDANNTRRVKYEDLIKDPDEKASTPEHLDQWSVQQIQGDLLSKSRIDSHDPTHIFGFIDPEQKRLEELKWALAQFHRIVDPETPIIEWTPQREEYPDKQLDALLNQYHGKPVSVIVHVDMTKVKYLNSFLGRLSAMYENFQVGFSRTSQVDTPMQRLFLLFKQTPEEIIRFCIQGPDENAEGLFSLLSRISPRNLSGPAPVQKAP